ncbi:M20/M25/M40 family metallo-hydrolase [Sphingomonas lutea]|uniref:M20/M25/M40 family metallo-hydrolase n=1 Tax=Sphingomonas lutea TaxID=1045317 RepID=A0A7G9SGV2_9SPHN|nr:M20/M25/M40 family metallo-hydrolase [Sphingomonas lutea]QNN67077.1 M20/M25/M40 family metallo-hydrolase [Sphingomonas lutea]
MRKFFILASLPVATSAAAIPPLPPPEAVVAEYSRAVDAARMRATVEKLVSFGTRHTLSSQTDPRRGIGAALRWAEGEMRRTGLPTSQVCDTVVKLPRIPTPTRVCNAVAIQRGTERPNDVVIITGHIDSRVSDPMNATADAPGANDDGSGTAAVMEAARVLAKRKFPGTIVYAVLSGEEQGLNGGKIMADYARAQGWNVIANLNNDIIGNSCGSDGTCNDKQVRVFSEGPRWQGREDLAARQRSLGGENDSPSRNLSRFLDTLAERMGPDLNLDVMPIWRNDRHGRGGDHTEFLNAGYSAIRMSVAVEDYDHQHQDLRVEKGVKYGDTIDEMNFPYLAKVTKLNVAALAWLASAPPPPEPTVEGAVSTDTTVKWREIPGADGYPAYKIWRRRTDASRWEIGEDGDIRVTGCTPGPCRNPDPGSRGIILPGIRVDDWVFGVSSVSANGFESPVASAVPGGAFKPYTPPPPPPAQ